MTEHIPFARPAISDDERKAVLDVVDSGWTTTGEVARTLEGELAALLGDGAHVVATSSCTAALEILFRSLRLSPGARVAVPTWTFAATAAAAMRAGLVPVLVDVEPDTLNVGPAQLATAADTGLDAVCLVHFGGRLVSLATYELAADHGLPVVEDSAHTIGTGDPHGRGGGCREGVAGAAFSFYATKNVSAGEGGAIATRDPVTAAFARADRLHGMTKDAWARYADDGPLTYDVGHVGLKANLSDLHAALALAQLRRLDDLQARRRRLLDEYASALAPLDGVELLPARREPSDAHHLAVVALAPGTDRDRVRRRLRADGVATSVHFVPLHHLTAFRDLERAGDGLPVADDLAGRVLSLPLFPDLTTDEVGTVVARLAAAL